MSVPAAHFVNGNPLTGPFEPHLKRAIFGMGCFWGVERKFWQLDGVYSTAVGYAGGDTPHPRYGEVCSGATGHAEVVLVIYDPNVVTFEQLLEVFWESHDPTQGDRQGNDRGSQYRSVIFTYDEQQLAAAKASAVSYGLQLEANGYGAITTQIEAAPAFNYAEEDHQQYLAKNPGGYCGLGGTGVTCAL